MGKTLKNYFSQWSTWRGILLLGAAAAGIHPDAANAVAVLGDAISAQNAAAIVAGSVGAYEVFKNERKRDKTKYWKG